jgi:hypothetical protein
VQGILQLYHILIGPLLFYTPMSKIGNVEPPVYTPWGCNPINAVLSTTRQQPSSCRFPITKPQQQQQQLPPPPIKQVNYVKKVTWFPHLSGCRLCSLHTFLTNSGHTIYKRTPGRQIKLTNHKLFIPDTKSDCCDKERQEHVVQ